MVKDLIIESTDLTKAYGSHIALDSLNIKIENGHYVFDFYSKDQMLRSLQFGLPGSHNLMNATVAIAMAFDQ